MIRNLVAAAGVVAALAGPLEAFAQRGSPPPKVAVVLSTSLATSSSRVTAFQQSMRERGYIDGQNVRIEPHAWGGASRPLEDLASELAQQNPAVIVAEGNVTLATLRKATRTIPIVMAVVGDPVGSGFVASLARPGGNVTGLSNTAEQLSSKRLELLKELVPNLVSVGVLRNPANRTHAILLRETESAARILGISLSTFDFAVESDVEPALQMMMTRRIQAAVVLPQPSVVVLRDALAGAAIRHRLPVVFPTHEPIDAGGLASYAPSSLDLWQRAAGYVDRILKGAQPSDLPVEQPTRFDLVVNLKTARALGIAVPPALLLRATRTIE